MPELRDALAAALDTEHDTPPQETERVNDALGEPLDAAPEPEIKAEAEGERVRDALGRFVPKEGGEAAPKPAEAAPAAQQGQPPAQPAAEAQAPAQASERPPVNVPPALREHWGTLPEGFRQYTLQREQQVQQVLQSTADARRFQQEFGQMVQPYLPFMRAEGAEPMQAIQNLMDIAVSLRTGSPQQKAQLVAQLVGNYGVDIGALDAALAGVAPQQPQGFDPSVIQREVQAALSPIVQAAQQRRAQMEQQTQAEVMSELEQFAQDPKNEFFHDLRNAMADIIEVAERQGRKMSLADAYQTAAMLHPEISQIMLARRQGQSVQSHSQAAQRAKAAAVSVKGSGADMSPAQAPDASTVRAAIEAAIDSNTRV